MYVLFQFFILIVVSGVLTFCDTFKKPSVLVAPASSQAKSVPKKKKTKRKRKEAEKSNEGKEFPEFVMPTESAKKKKLREVEEDKKKKIKEGFYQEKSDVDDTLEKIDSLRLEKSDRTKRAQKKQKEKIKQINI